MGPAQSYFFAKARFFYPETTFSVIWQVSEPIGLIFNIRALFPVFHLWDGMGQPFIDQFIIGAGIGIAIRLGSAPKRPRLRQPPPHRGSCACSPCTRGPCTRGSCARRSCARRAGRSRRRKSTEYPGALNPRGTLAP